MPQSVEEQVENTVATMSGRVGTHLNAELDKRFQGLYDHIDTQVRHNGTSDKRPR